MNEPKKTSMFKVGAKVKFDGEAHTVAAWDGPSVTLRSADGAAWRVSTAELFGAKDFRVLEGDARTEPGEPSGDHHSAATFPDNAPEEARAQALDRLAHLREAATGYRSSSAEAALPGEPDPRYDPALTTYHERVVAKARELGVDERTIRRRRRAYEERGLEGLIDSRRLKESNPLGSLDPRVHETLLEVLDELTDKSTVTNERKRRLVRLRLARKYGEGTVACPGKTTFNKVVREIEKGRGALGSAKARRSAARRPETPYSGFKATRAGQYVLIDSTPLDAFAMDAVTFRWIPLELTLGFDLFTRSIVAARFTARGANRADAALLYYDIITPKVAPPDWPEEAKFGRRYTGIPDHVVVELGAEDTAAVPLVNPETFVVDNGKIFVSRAFQDACARVGTNIIYARAAKPTDKSAIERVFRTIREQFVENLPGYKGPDLYSRGSDVEKEAFYFLHEIEELFWEWVAVFWQPRHHGGLEIPGLPNMNLSPDEAYDESIARCGFLYVAPHPNLYYELLPTEWREVHHYGVEFRGMRYDGGILNGLRGSTSPYGGEYRGKWPIRYDPRDISCVFFFDHRSREWHALDRRDSRVPNMPFNEATLSHAKALLRERGGNVRNHRELSLVLDGLVERMEHHEHTNKEERRLAARRFLQAERARRDRGGTARSFASGPPGHGTRHEELAAPDAPADPFDFDLGPVPVMPDVDDEDESYGLDMFPNNPYEEED